jgi:hypothetical protein
LKKILVLIGGTFKSIDEKWWIQFSETANIDLDFALSTWSGSKIDFGDWIRSKTVWLDQEDPKKVELLYQSLIPAIISVQEGTKPFNTLMMWHKWGRFSRFDQFDKYDCIIKTRADIDVDTRYIENIVKAIEMVVGTTNTLAIPSGGDHGKSLKGHRQAINDVFAIGSPQSMRKYLSITNSWSKHYEAAKIFHPETLLRFHLIDQNQMYLIRFPALLYLRGGEYNHLTTRWYKDTLPFQSNFLHRKIDRIKRSGKFF